eukprot:m.40175 g.40175  ORF g.40175 m.40175 type:complete len:173 (+) comp8046_c0_seq1:248-766(+)
MLPAIRPGGGDNPRFSASRNSSASSNGSARRRSALGSAKMPVLKGGSKRRASRDRMTWHLPQELKESHQRLCKKKDQEGKGGRGADGSLGDGGDATQRVVDATRSVMVKRQIHEESRQRLYKKHLRDQNEVGRQRREQLLEDTRKKMQIIKDERKRRQNSSQPNIEVTDEKI